MVKKKDTNIHSLIPLILIVGVIFVLIESEVSHFFSGLFEGWLGVIVQIVGLAGTLLALIWVSSTIISYLPGEKKHHERLKDPVYLFLGIVATLCLLTLILVFITFIAPL